jgi:hypothetical protein
MAQEIQFTSDQTGSLERMQGSDGRANVSSRSDSRAYYNSRDSGQTYSIAFDFQSAEAGEFGAYLKNTSTTGKIFVVDSIGINSFEASRIKLWFVTGVAAGGTSIIPTNLNKTSGNAATAIAMEGGSAAAGITGLSEDGLIDIAYIQGTGHEEFRLNDRLRLGQNDAIAIEYEEGTAGDFSGVIFGYFE